MVPATLWGMVFGRRMPDSDKESAS